MHIRGLRTATVAAIIAVAALSRPLVVGAEKPERLIIKCAKPCAGAIGAVAALGGETTFVYDNVDAIAATVPASRVRELTAAVGADAVRKDVTVSLPPREAVEADGPISASEVSGDAIAGFVGAQPANYNYNNSLTNAAAAARRWCGRRERRRRRDRQRDHVLGARRAAAPCTRRHSDRRGELRPGHC